MPTERRFLILSASMGEGHATVAAELARRLRARGDRAARVVDVLALLPPGIGPALRGFYRGMVRHSPWLYEGIYAAFLRTGPGPRPGSAPLAALAEGRLRACVERWRPDGVVSTFHLAAQVTGRLRARGALEVPSTVVITDFAVHRQWLHPGNDLHLCVTEGAAKQVRHAIGAPAAAPGPVVPPAFFRPGLGPWTDKFARQAPGRPPILLGTGAWGVGSGLETTAALLARAGYLPVLLCGRDERLRLRLRLRAATLPDVVALGWLSDLAPLMTAARALVDNAAGQTAVQALAAGLPVIGYRPIPGHGAEGVREMATAGLSEYARTPHDLLGALERLTVPGPPREHRIAAARAAFAADAAQLIDQAALIRADDASA